MERVEFTEGELEELKRIGARIREALEALPMPQAIEWQPDAEAAEMMKIWEEDD